MTRNRGAHRIAFATLFVASAAAAQTRGTASLGVMGQQTSLLGSFWPGVVGSAGFSVRIAPFIAVRAEGEAAGFPAGGAAEADCIANAVCRSEKTPWGIAGASALVLLRHDDLPLFAGIGVGAWRASDGDGFHGGPTYVGGLTLSRRRRIAIEARYNRPSTAMGIVTSTLSFGLRFAP
jgi:hypothetical protein